VKIGKKDADLTAYNHLDLSLERTKNVMVCILCLHCALCTWNMGKANRVQWKVYF